MNLVEKYDANNSYYPLEVIANKAVQGIRFETIDNNIYKTKVDFGDGTLRNGSGVVGSASFVGTSTKNYLDSYTGKIKIYNNPKQVRKIVLDFGIDGSSADPNFLNVKNSILTPDILDYFNETEYFYFSHYCYGSTHNALQGKVTGEWAGKCGNKLKSLELVNCDYPLSNPTFNLNIIPKNSILEVLKVGSGYSVANNYISVSGDLANIPSTCKVVWLGGDRLGTSNSITGTIPNWVEEFQRLGNNTISGSVLNLNSNMRYLNLQGNNTLKDSLDSFPFMNYFYLSGNNTISGNLINLINSGTIFISGNNTVSGSIPNLTKCTNLRISGNNHISGPVPTLDTITQFSISGNNELSDVLDLPNATNVTVSGQNILSDINLPKAIGVVIQGNNTISGDLYKKVNSEAINIQISGFNTISSISGVFTNVIQINLTGNNILTDNILSNFPNATNIQIGGNNTIVYAGKTFPPAMNSIDITGKAALKTDMVNQLLKDLNQTTWTGNNKRIIIKGNSQPPSPDVIEIIQSLVSKGISVSTN